MAAYAFARIKFPGREILFLFVLIQMMVPGQIFIIPQYLMVQKLGMLNSISALVFPGIVTAFGTFLLRQFFMGLPEEIEEAAIIDGANRWQIFWRVMLPLAKPGIATITMLSAMGFWNEYPLALVLLTDDAKKTLPIGMANLFEVQKYATDWGALFAGLVIIMIPTMIIYLIGQRYLLQGIGAGGLKG